jgi:hypothetical protein
MNLLSESTEVFNLLLFNQPIRRKVSERRLSLLVDQSRGTAEAVRSLKQNLEWQQSGAIPVRLNQTLDLSLTSTRGQLQMS